MLTSRTGAFVFCHPCTRLFGPRSLGISQRHKVENVTKPELQEVVETMRRIDADPNEKVDQETVRRWMESNDLQVLGAVYYVLFDGRYYPKIEPAFTLNDYKMFLLPYYERCLREDPQADWSSPRYTAGWDLVGWFMCLWRDKSVPRATLGEIKDWLGTMYVNGDEDLRTCLVTATLEHLFEDRKVADRKSVV